MPIMPNGVFWNIEDVRGNLKYSENVAAALRKLSSVHGMKSVAEMRLAELDAEAAELRAVIAEYEARISA